MKSNINIYHRIYLLLLLFMPISVITTQRAVSSDGMPSDRAAFFRFGEQFFFDAYSQPISNGDSMQAYVFYRIAYDALLFHQSSDGNGFYTILQIDAAFRDNSSIIRRRAIRLDTINVSSFEETKRKDRHLVGFLDANLAMSNFTVQVQVTDNRNQNIHRHTAELIINSINNGNSKLFNPSYNIVNRGLINLSIITNSIPFSSKPVKIYLPSILDESSNSFSYFIARKEERGQPNWGQFNNIQGSVNILKNQSLEFDLSDQHIITNIQKNNEHIDSKFGLLLIELSGNSFVPGNYDLFVINNFSKDTIKYNFSTKWENMPLSLRNPEYAVKMMEYILTDAEFRAMRSGSNNERMRKMLEYWKIHDPTPNTPYNEAMAEYFRRVDYAFFNFQTLTEKDGAATDRGKIYILFGTPDNIRTSLKGNKSQEIWHYQSLIKEFTFDLVSTGVYKLTEIKE